MCNFAWGEAFLHKAEQFPHRLVLPFTADFLEPLKTIRKNWFISSNEWSIESVSHLKNNFSLFTSLEVLWTYFPVLVHGDQIENLSFKSIICLDYHNWEYFFLISLNMNFQQSLYIDRYVWKKIFSIRVRKQMYYRS